MRAVLLIVIAAVCGLITVLLFRVTTSPKAIQATGKRIQARLLEFRLFADEPALILGAQFGVLWETARMMALLLLPTLTSALIATALFSGLEALFGWEALPIGQAAIVTAQLTGTAGQTCELDAPRGIAVESPPVHVLAQRQVSWRIRPLRTEQGVLRIRCDGGWIESPISAGTRGLTLQRRVVRPEDGLAWVEVTYPGTSWEGWFLGLWTLSAVIWARIRKA